MARIDSVKAADGRRQRSRKIIDEERKILDQKRILANTSTRLERNGFCDSDKARKRIYHKEKIESNEQSKEEGQPKSIYGKGRDARQSQKL